MTEKTLCLTAVAGAVLWLWPGFRWRVKAGLTALGVLIVTVIALTGGDVLNVLPS